METDFGRAVGKSVGEVMRDVTEFLSLSYPVHPKKQIDLNTLLPELNMAEQLTFALFAEADAHGWEPHAIEAFCRQAVSPVAGDAVVDKITAAFRAREGEDFRRLEKLYGNRFVLLDGSYWATCLALGIDAEQVGEVLYYLRLFVVTMMGFAYMEDRNPSETYTWQYYASFRGMLDELTKAPDPDPLPLKITKIGGSAGKRDGDGYLLSLGVDVQNPNEDRMARDVSLDVTLKDKDGEVITVIKDRIQSLDPKATYHYGVTRKIRGAAVASFSATAKAASHIKLTTPIMKHIKLTSLRFTRAEDSTAMNCKLTSEYDMPLRAATLHYQHLDESGRIIGGSGEWFLEGFSAGEVKDVTSKVAIPLPSVKKVIYSMDFDALELVKE